MIYLVLAILYEIISTALLRKRWFLSVYLVIESSFMTSDISY